MISGIDINKIVVSNKQKYVVDNDKIEIYSDVEYSDDSDEENSDEKIQTKKIKYIKLFLAKNIFFKNKKNIRALQVPS